MWVKAGLSNGSKTFNVENSLAPGVGLYLFLIVIRFRDVCNCMRIEEADC